MTKDVDLTISNLLEGHAEYTPVEGSVDASPATPAKPSAPQVGTLSC